MAYRGVLDDVRACCELRTPSRLPIFALGLEFDMETAGVSCRESRLDVDKTVRCKVEAVRRFNYDLAEVFPDDYIEFEPLGLSMRDDEDHPAMPESYFDMTPDTLTGFSFPDPDRDGRLPIHLEMIRRLKEELGDTTCVMGRIAAPFSTLGLIYGIDTLFLTMMDSPELIKDNLSFFVDHQILVAKAQVKAGADVLWLGDCVADSKLLSPGHFRDFAMAAAAAVAEGLADSGAVIIYHTCETSPEHLKLQAQLPVSAVNVGEGADLATIKQTIGTPMCLAGNIDPVLLRDGTPEDIASATIDMIDSAAPGGGYIFNTGEGIMRNTPVENVAAMMTAAKNTSWAKGQQSD